MAKRAETNDSIKPEEISQEKKTVHTGESELRKFESFLNAVASSKENDKTSGSDTVRKDDLVLLAKIIDVLEYTVQDLTEHYFYKYDRYSDMGRVGVIWEYDRNRVRAEVIHEYILQAKKQIEHLDIGGW